MGFTSLLFLGAASLLGLLFGSFLNVCISRVPRHESLWRPRSHCRACGATIAWYDNVPVLSWLLLRGRCRRCRERISWRYPAVEAAVALWFTVEAAVWWHLAMARGFWMSLSTSYTVAAAAATVGAAIVGLLLIGLLVMDWQTQTLPNAFTVTGIVIGFLMACVRVGLLAPRQDEVLLHGPNPLSSPGNVVDAGNVILTGPEHVILGWLAAVLGAACLLLAIRWLYLRLRGREGMGLGDVKLLAMIAAFLGFWPAMLALFVGVVLCSAYALALMARGRAGAVTRLPLGTFLCVGGLVSAVAGKELIAWYSSLFL